MKKVKTIFNNSSTTFYFNASFNDLQKLLLKEDSIIITDDNVFKSQKKLFNNLKIIVLKAGEQYKTQSTVDNIINQLIQLGADRKTFLIGVGGGVVTDITGFIAGIYMRGIRFGFIPTSILAMVDAAIGGKNGIDVGVYKNMVGLIRQPEFLIYDYSLLKSLPKTEWINGFAEIIKHSCVKDAAMFKMLENYSLNEFQNNDALLHKLIQRNALLKARFVQEDEFEQGNRKMLNFGHTIGHAIENQYQLPHGKAVSIGMAYDVKISQQITGLKHADRIINLIEKYNLPVSFSFAKHKMFDVLSKDKKTEGQEINYVLLNEIGKAVIQSISLKNLEKMILNL